MKRTNAERLIARLEKEVKEAKEEEQRIFDEPNPDWDRRFDDEAEARGVIEGLNTALKLVRKYLEKAEKPVDKKDKDSLAHEVLVKYAQQRMRNELDQGEICPEFSSLEDAYLKGKRDARIELCRFLLGLQS